MADKKGYHKKKIQNMKDSGFGDYQESTGGGHPFDLGDSNTRTTRENGKLREKENQSSQPRDDKGRFQYNSVNGKGLKYPSRGKTVNPLLTGGVGGIYIDDVKEQFEKKEGEYWEKYKNKWYRKGGEIVINNKVRIADEDIWEIARRSYDVKKKEITGESSTFDETKKGRHSKEEAAAIHKRGKENPVIQKETGGIKVKGEKLIKHSKAIKPADDANEEQPVEPAKEDSFGSGKYTRAEADAVREELKKNGQYDAALDDDNVLEKYIEAAGGKDLFDYGNNESETEKKVREMGFDGK